MARKDLVKIYIIKQREKWYYVPSSRKQLEYGTTMVPLPKMQHQKVTLRKDEQVLSNGQSAEQLTCILQKCPHQQTNTENFSTLSSVATESLETSALTLFCRDITATVGNLTESSALKQQYYFPGFDYRILLVQAWNDWSIFFNHNNIKIEISNKFGA